MFGFIKNFARKLASKPAETDFASAPETEFAPEPESGAEHQAYTPAPVAKPMHGSHPASKGVEVPLQGILQSLPLELQPRIKSMNVGDATVSVPLEKILSQLSRGSVKVSFGELRQAAPFAGRSPPCRDSFPT